jgi:hypothetical protein
MAKPTGRNLSSDAHARIGIETGQGMTGSLTLRPADRQDTGNEDRPVPPATFLISPDEGLQATGHGMTFRPCRP